MRDGDVRTVLLDYLNSVYLNQSDAVIVEELGLRNGSVRADVAVVNGSLKGYEIKSDRDTLKRLHRQSDLYNRVFDTATIVVSESHLRDASSVVADWWGIYVVVFGSATYDLVPFRAERQNTDVDALELAQLLWRNEALAILERFGNSGDLQRKPRKYIWRALADCLELEVLKNSVRDALKTRKGWRVAATQKQCGATCLPSAMSSGFPCPLSGPRIRRYSNRPN